MSGGLFASEKSVHTALPCQAQLPKVSLKIMRQNFQNYNDFQIENFNLIKLDQDNLNAWPFCPLKKRTFWIFCWPAAKNSKDFHIDHDQSLKAPKIVNVFQMLRAAKKLPWSVAKNSQKIVMARCIWVHLVVCPGAILCFLFIYGDLSI